MNRFILSCFPLSSIAFAAAKDYDPMALLQKPAADVKPPPKMPLGSYVAQGLDYEFSKTKPKDQSKAPTSICQTKFVLVEAFPDVNKDELAAFIAEKGPLDEVEQRPQDWFLTPDALYRLTEHLINDCKLGEDAGGSTAEKLEAYKAGAQFGVEIGQVPNAREPSNPYHQPVRFFALPD